MQQELLSLNDKLSKCKLLVMDVDGTLTDGSLYYGVNGEELKRFYVRDGMGIVLLHKAGIKTAILTSENSKIVLARGQKLGIDEIILGSRNKTKDFNTLLKKLNIKPDEAVFIGDDLNDKHLMEKVHFSVCPHDAIPQIRNIADYICSAPGGNGAVREICELILIARKIGVKLDEDW